VATPFEAEPCDCHDLSGDGLDDLSMKFATLDVVAALELWDSAGGDEVELVVTGALLDGASFVTNSDCIVIVPRTNQTIAARPGSRRSLAGRASQNSARSSP
jgi:hypothetical protein